MKWAGERRGKKYIQKTHQSSDYDIISTIEKILTR